MWEGEEGDSVFDKKGGPTPKQRLLGWIQSKLPDLPINNFNSDWNDGRAVAALVDALAPGKYIVPYLIFKLTHID